MLVKRILALPGDRVQTLPPHPDLTVTIPPGHAWVEGTPRMYSPFQELNLSQEMINGDQKTVITLDL